MKKSPAKKKKCTLCGNTYALSEKYFYPQKSRKTGFSHYCRECTRKRASEKYIADPDKYKERSLKYFYEHKEEQREAQRQYYQKNKQKILKARKEYYRGKVNKNKD